MSVQTWTPPVAPTAQGTQLQETPRVISNTQGAGFPADAPDGEINLLPGALSLTWGALTQAQWTTITTFMKANVGKPFGFAIAGQPLRDWVWVGAMTTTYLDGNNRTLTVQLEERFLP